MKLFFLVIALCLNLPAFAQLKPIYLNRDIIVKDSTQATSYGVFGKLSSEDLYVLKIFDLDNNLLTTGTYKDDNLKIPHGAFVYYADLNTFNEINMENFFLKGKSRFISGRGSFDDGRKTGRWISFFPDGRLMNVTTYINGVKHGFYGEYNRKGKVIASGVYAMDERDGEWLQDRKSVV